MADGRWQSLPSVLCLCALRTRNPNLPQYETDCCKSGRIPAPRTADSTLILEARDEATGEHVETHSGDWSPSPPLVRPLVKSRIVKSERELS